MTSILLVDDDVAFRKMLQLVLKRAGYAVQEAGNGRDALALYETEPCDLIITDLVMPEMEGIEAIMQFRRFDPEAKIIAMSGGGRLKPSVSLAAAHKLGAVRTLAKPFSHRELLDAVAEILGAPPG